MSGRSWLKLSGKRYRCVPLYVPIDELDPLERLFLKVLDEEHNITLLVQMFDLTDRIVEDVLGDLIRKNRARLVVTDGQKEIHPSGNTIPIVTYQRGTAFDVWQDDDTGLVLPASVVDGLDRPSDPRSIADLESKIFVLPNTELRLLDEFPGLPDAQIIDILVRADKELGQNDAGEYQLDRLTDRYRIRPQTIWLPVQEAQLQRHLIQQMASEQIPQWAARTWSVALRRDAFSEPNELLELNMAALAAGDGHRVVHDWRIGAHLAKWRDAVDRFLHMIPSPASGYDLREVREHEAAVRGLLLSMGGIELLKSDVTSGEYDWIQGVIEASRDWLALIIPSSQPPGPVVAWIQKAFGLGRNFPSSLIVVSSDCSDLSKYEPILRSVPQIKSARVLWRAWAHLGPFVVMAMLWRFGCSICEKGRSFGVLEKAYGMNGWGCCKLCL